MKSFTTTQDMTQYEVSQDYCEPYLGATHDDLQAARFNKYDTHIDKNEFFVYDDVNHKYNIYHRVEYIENTSNAYIDTEIKASNTINVDTQFQFKNILGGTKNMWIFGGRNSSTSSQLSVFVLTDGTVRYCWSNKENEIKKLITDDTKDYKIVTNANTLTIFNDVISNNITVSGASGTFVSNQSIYIFNLNVPGVSIVPFVGKLYYFKLYNGNTLIRDFIPVKNILTNQYGLLDTVEQKFYVSPNGVEFNGGNEIIEDKDGIQYRKKNYIYINSTQQQYITLKPFTDTDNVELKVYPIGSTNYWFGDRSGGTASRLFQIASWNNTRLDIAYTNSQFPSITYSQGIVNKNLVLRLYDKKFYVNNELLYTFTSNLTTTNNTNLGRVYNVGRATNSRFFWFKWWNGNKDLLYDLIPVQRCSDGVWGFFDKVKEDFHPSEGTEQFTGG